MRVLKRTRIILLIITVVLVCYFVIQSGVFKIIANMDFDKVLLKILTNQYVSGILCSVIAILILYVFQKEYSKYMIKKDFRCYEIIRDLNCGIEDTKTLLQKCPEIKIHYSGEEEKDAIKLLNHCLDNREKIGASNFSFVYDNNKILIESIQTSFFINLNFKLLGIINNIKNRIPNLIEEYPDVEQILRKMSRENVSDNAINNASCIGKYLMDLRFMAMYWKELLDYLKYDSTYIKKVIEIYERQLNAVEDCKAGIIVIEEHCKKAMKQARREIIKERIKKLWW